MGNNEATTSIDNVQSFYVLLIPEENKMKIPEENETKIPEENETNKDDDSIKTRLIEIGKKKLPAAENECFWAYVEKFDNDIGKIEDELEAQSYERVTVTTCTIKAKHIAGNGKYIMVNRDERRTSIHYLLELPSEINNIQNIFNIIKEGSFFLAVKNPKMKTTLAAGFNQFQDVKFSPEIQQKFGSSKWLPGLYEMFFLL